MKDSSAQSGAMNPKGFVSPDAITKYFEESKAPLLSAPLVKDESKETNEVRDASRSDKYNVTRVDGQVKGKWFDKREPKPLTDISFRR